MREPVTREEQLLSAIATGGDILYPITRKEMYLAYLAGDTSISLPEPVTRKEQFLYQACLTGGSGGSTGGNTGGSGGSVVSVPAKEVNFYDYDGTLLHAYTVAEAQAMTELPALPERPGLICQGWNYDLETIKAYNRRVDVGATYTTDDGTTRIYIHLEDGRTSPMLGVCPNGTVTVDWGDGTEPDVLTGTNTGAVNWTPNHEYAKPGDYAIRLAVEGEVKLSGMRSSDQYSYILRHAPGSDRRNTVYRSAIQRIEIGNGVTSIGNTAFYDCYSLASIVIPDSVTSIGNNAFSNCYGVRYYDFTKHSAVPTLSSTNAFNGIAADCEIRVPAALYDEWIAATNWATYASYIKAV